MPRARLLAHPSRALRRGAACVAAAVLVLVTALYLLAPRVLQLAELGLYDEHFRLRGPHAGDGRVVIVAIDEASLRQVGRWPWPRSVLADLVRRLDEAGSAAIALDILLDEPEKSGELRATARIAERLGPLGLGPQVRETLHAVAGEFDHDGRLASAIRASGRVVLASHFALGPAATGAPPARDGQPVKGAFAAFKSYGDRGVFAPPHAVAAGFPIPPLLDAAASVGHVDMMADLDGATRWEALAVESRGHYYPSLALQAVRVAAGLDPFALRLDFGHEVTLDNVAIPIDAQARVLVDYAGPSPSFTHVPAADVLAGRVDPARLRDRLVFVGATAEGTYDLRVTPFSPVFPGVEKHANVAADILARRFIVRPPWVELFELGLALVFPLALAWVLPRLRPLPSFLATLALWAAFVGAVHAAFRAGLWLPMAYPSVAVALTFVGVTILRMLTEERQRMWMKHAFERYVSPEVVERIVRDPGALQFGGESRCVTVLFSDIRDFTGFTERHAPDEVVQMLREHLTHMTERILAEHGTLDKYIGDAIMALFGAPIPLPDHAERACRAALAMAGELERLQAKWIAEGKEPFRIGIGINTDDVVVGNLGSEQLFDYTAVGDGVNLGARLEALNKDYRTARAIIISASTYEAARDAIEARPLGEVMVKGKTRPVGIYELIGLRR